jgi:hypothetical protein
MPAPFMSGTWQPDSSMFSIVVSAGDDPDRLALRARAVRVDVRSTVHAADREAVLRPRADVAGVAARGVDEDRVAGRGGGDRGARRRVRMARADLERRRA